MAAYGKSKKDSDFLDLKQLGERIRTDESIRFFLITGEEDFFIDLAIKSIKDKYLSAEAESMDFTKLDFGGKSIDFDSLYANITAPSWLSSRRIVQVSNFSLDTKDSDSLISIIESIPPEAILIIVPSEVDKRKKRLFETYKKHGILARIDYLDKDALMSWITRRFAKENISIETDACLSLISRCERSMRLISGECTKLALYCGGSGIQTIDESTVELCCPPDMQGNIFRIMENVGKGNAAQALIGVNNLINLKESPIRIRFMLTRHFKQLICAKELGNISEIMSRLNVMDFQARDLLNQSRRFTIERLSSLYSESARIDTEIKQGLANDRQALESFIISVSCG